uniref:HSL_N domain-containing protein n=1 Tax=Syphacia muris TaxID=451379 RepID=A0A0N5AQV4_9BILA
MVSVGEIKNDGAASSKSKIGERLSVKRSCLCDLLIKLAEDNANFFGHSTFPATYTKRLYESCSEIAISTKALIGLVNTVHGMAPRYDFDSCTPGNGFRSLVCITDIVVLHLISLLRSCSEKRHTLIFRSSYYCKEIEAYAAILRFFVLSLQQVLLHFLFF